LSAGRFHLVTWTSRGSFPAALWQAFGAQMTERHGGLRFPFNGGFSTRPNNLDLY
jgi:hypothetical protein